MMTTYSPSLSNQGDEFPTFFQEQKLASYPELPHCPGNNMYLNAPSTAQYLSLELAGGSESRFKVNSVNNPQGSLSPKDMQYSSSLCELSDLASTNFTSKYLKAAQQLLDEVVNVRSALKQHEFGPDGSVVKSKNCSLPPLSNVMSLDPHESTTKSSCEPSPAEQQDLQKKMTKLFSMLDEVDRRYKQYSHQMQIVVSSFEMTAGSGTAKPYTALALQTISRHFRCLRDAINSQIQVIRQSLGEQYATPNGRAGGLSRLRYVDHERRQQRALQQLGMTRHSWRPQRGLPETSVSILRAWMFEHFLHPYPKESEKIMLARQTGLTRSQVANWFINARVRLWKPMVEEMYTDEFGDLEADSKSSPENAAKEARDKSWATDDLGEELQGSATSKAAYVGHSGGFNDSNSDFTPNKQINDGPNGDDHGLFPDEIIPPNHCGDGNLLASSATYDFSQLGSFGIGNQVSLELQLRHCENDAFSTSGWSQLKQDMGPDTADYQFTNPVKPRERFGDPHLLPDFVA